MAKKKTTTSQTEAQQIFGALSQTSQDIILLRIQSAAHDFDYCMSTQSTWHDFISNAFTWAATPEKHNFWAGIAASDNAEYIEDQIIETLAVPVPDITEDTITGTEFMNELPRVIANLVQDDFIRHLGSDEFIEFSQEEGTRADHWERIEDPMEEMGDGSIFHFMFKTIGYQSLPSSVLIEKWTGINDENRDTFIKNCEKAGVDLSVPISAFHTIDFSPVLTDEGIKKIHKLDCITGEHLLKVNMKNTFQITEAKFQEVKSQIASRFAYSEDVVEMLYTAMRCGEHCVMFGPGGHGKSEMSIEFFKALGINQATKKATKKSVEDVEDEEIKEIKENKEPTLFVQVLGPGTTIEKLFGGIDMELFRTPGKIQYLVEESFMNHEYVIFEEAFDAPPYVLSTLKDILTSKVFRDGEFQFPIKTKMIVINTNHSRAEIANDLSIKALMERFPLELEVKWQAYHEGNYMNMFNLLFGSSTEVKNYNTVAKLCGTLYSEGITISPRTAVKMAKIYSTVGAAGLKYIAEVPASAYDELATLENAAKQDQISKDLLEGYATQITELYAKTEEQITDHTECLKASKSFARIRKALDKITVTESYFEEKQRLMDSCDTYHNFFKDKALENVEEDQQS
jgi:hypothetical protein